MVEILKSNPLLMGSVFTSAYFVIQITLLEIYKHLRYTTKAFTYVKNLKIMYTVLFFIGVIFTAIGFILLKQ